jgi:hypothetical protein
MDLTLPVKCEMCGAAVRKEGAAVPKEAKRPPDEDAAQPAAAKKQVTGALAAVVGSMAKGSTGPAVRPMGMVLDVVGTARGDRGRNCDEHEICGEVLAEDVVVRLRREQILVPNKLGKGFKEETAYTVNWVTDGIVAVLAFFLVPTLRRGGYLTEFFVRSSGLATSLTTTRTSGPR